MPSKKILYYSFTGLFSVLALSASGFWLINYNWATDWFLKMGIHPVLVYPIAMFQVLGVILLWSKIQFAAIKWVYIAFAGIFVFATLSHLIGGDGLAVIPIFMGFILFLSYKFRTGFSMLEYSVKVQEEEPWDKSE